MLQIASGVGDYTYMVGGNHPNSAEATESPCAGAVRRGAHLRRAAKKMRRARFMSTGHRRAAKRP